MKISVLVLLLVKYWPLDDQNETFLRFLFFYAKLLQL